MFLTVVNIFLFFINKVTGSRYATVLDFFPRRRRVPVQLTRVKLQLGYLTSVALLLLVVADVLDTLVKPASAYTFSELYKLATVQRMQQSPRHQ